MDLAPIVLFVYNRPWHTLQTLSALKNNDLADQSSLYIYADGPKVNASKEDIDKINEVRQTIQKEKWCKEVVIVERDENFGLAKSVIVGVTEIVNKYGKIIVLEDDIKVSKHFLEYMNNALVAYELENKVAGISAFCYPNQGQLKSTYFLPIGCSWGWSTWARSWVNFEKEASKLIHSIKEQNLVAHFNFGGYQFYKMLQNQCDEIIDSWAVRFYASFFLRSQLFLYPEKSLVRNIGFDTSGTHTSQSDGYFNTEEAMGIDFRKHAVELNDACVKSVRSSFEAKEANVNQSLVQKIFFFLKK